MIIRRVSKARTHLTKKSRRLSSSGRFIDENLDRVRLNSEESIRAGSGHAHGAAKPANLSLHGTL